jgi:4-aminobutyrate aminotransferase
MKHSLNEQLMARKAAATPRGVGVMGSFFADKALNSELWDVEGRRFIDFAGGIAVMNTGHRHPKVVQALQAQLERFTHTCYQVVPYESYIALAEKLNALTPGTHAKKTALFSTGAEAVENAIKIARAATKRSGVIAFSGAFHGRSMLALARCSLTKLTLDLLHQRFFMRLSHAIAPIWKKLKKRFTISSNQILSQPA